MHKTKRTPVHTSLARPFRLLATATATAASVYVLAAACPAGAATAPDHLGKLVHRVPLTGTFQIVNYNSGLCLGIWNDQNDQFAVQWDCNGNNDQQWHFGSQNSTYPNSYQLVNRNGSCLGVYGGSLNQGAQAVGWSCNGNYDQYWIPLGFSSCNGIVLENLNSGYVLDVSDNSKSQGAAVIQWGFKGICDNNQFWSL